MEIGISSTVENVSLQASSGNSPEASDAASLKQADLAVKVGVSVLKMVMDEQKLLGKSLLDMLV